jgi:hypothetical protein
MTLCAQLMTPFDSLMTPFDSLMTPFGSIMTTLQLLLHVETHSKNRGECEVGPDSHHFRSDSLHYGFCLIFAVFAFIIATRDILFDCFQPLCAHGGLKKNLRKIVEETLKFSVNLPSGVI